MRCPSEAELYRFVDVDLSPEQLGRIEAHLLGCPACAKQVNELRELTKDVSAALPQESFDVTAHVQGVMQRLEQPLTGARTPARWLRGALWSGVAALAMAAVVALFAYDPRQPLDGEYTARGGDHEASLARDVGIQLYTQATALRSLSSGSRIPRTAALTAGLRNLGKDRVYLLLFAVDSQQAVHWIAPEYTVAGSDPEAAPVAPTAAERLLSSAAVFDDLAPGALRVYALITREPTRVSQVEQLPPSELDDKRLSARFPDALVRQFSLEVTP